jgi:hypothetical protein
MGINFCLSSYIITFLYVERRHIQISLYVYVVERIVVLSSTNIATVINIYNFNRGIYQII